MDGAVEQVSLHLGAVFISSCKALSLTSATLQTSAVVLIKFYISVRAGNQKILRIVRVKVRSTS